jgi:hypothetical protein
VLPSTLTNTDHLAQSLHTPSASAPNSSPHIFREISLELFTPHFSPSSPASLIQDEADPDPEPEFYTYPCRCSALFRITSEQLEQGVNVVGCEGCGEWIKVGYEVVEGDDGDGGEGDGTEGEDVG